MVLYHAVQGDQVAIDVVEHFDWSRLRAQEVERPATGEDFDVTFVGWEQRDKAIGKAAFAAHPRDDGRRHNLQDLYCMDKQVLGSLRFVHRAGALAGLAGRDCGFGGRAGC